MPNLETGHTEYQQDLKKNASKEQAKESNNGTTKELEDFKKKLDQAKKISFQKDSTINANIKKLEEEIKTLEKTRMKNNSISKVTISKLEEERNETLQKTDYKYYEKLLNKPFMTAEDKENMKKSIQYLIDNKMDTPENIKKLEAVIYGSNFIEIAGIKFSKRKLIPRAPFKTNHNKSDIFENSEKGIFKVKKNGKEEYYFTTEAYINECKKQGKKTIVAHDVRRALQALPIDYPEYSDGSYVGGQNILGNILNLSMTGYINTKEEWRTESGGYLGTASASWKDYVWAYLFTEQIGVLSGVESRYLACPCLFIVE